MLTNEKLTVAAVEAEIEAKKAGFSKDMRHLRALRRVLVDESKGQQPLFPEMAQPEPQIEKITEASETTATGRPSHSASSGGGSSACSTPASAAEPQTAPGEVPPADTKPRRSRSRPAGATGDPNNCL